jgi:protein arginine kinase
MKGKQMNEQSNINIFDSKPWSQNNNSIWLGSTVSLIRNLEKFFFPGKLSTDKRKQIISLLSKDLLGSQWLKQPRLIKAEDMSPLEKEFLVEHFLSSETFQQAYTGEAFILDETGEFLGLLNLRDHLVLMSIDCKEEIESTWDRLVKIEMQLHKNVHFAFSPRFGFLTSDPGQCGTGLVVYTFLHLPALIYADQLDEVIKKYKDDGIERTGLQGDPQEIIGDIVVFHNQYTLGLTEESILSSLRTFTTKVLVEEKSARSHLKHENLSHMKDRISRAYAILLHSYQIEAIEALQAISLLKLGLDLDWLSGATHTSLNELIFSCRRAHLLCQSKAKITQEELPHRRAEFIHQALKGVTLHI